MRVRESAQGGTDLNGDGDAADVVWHLVDPAGAVRDLRLAGGNPLQGENGRFIFMVSEPSQGASDFNGDGDGSDFVLHLFDTAAEQLANTRLAVTAHTLRGGLAAVTVSEFGQAGTDLNGDGDAFDPVMHVVDLETGQVTNLGIASPSSLEPGVNGSEVVVPVIESAQGGADLNGDGDTNDFVLYVYDSALGLVMNTRLAGQPLGARAGAAAGFLASESGQGNADLNGDGDVLDQVLYVYDRDTAAVRNLGLATFSALASDTVVVFLVSESNQGADLNLDGDRADSFAFAYDVAAQKLLNLGVSATAVAADRRRFALSVAEAGEGDLNGDEDVVDFVLHTWVAPTAPSDTTQIRLAVEGPGTAAFKSSGHRAATLSILREIDVLIATGDVDEAIRKLENLGNRINGCGTAPDADDWIVDCTAQKNVRSRVEDLIAALRS